MGERALLGSVVPEMDCPHPIIANSAVGSNPPLPPVHFEQPWQRKVQVKCVAVKVVLRVVATGFVEVYMIGSIKPFAILKEWRIVLPSAHAISNRLFTIPPPNEMPE